MPSIDCNNLFPVMDHSTRAPVDKKPEDGTKRSERSDALLDGSKSTLESPRSQSTAETFTDQSSLCSEEDDFYQDHNGNEGGDSDGNNTDDDEVQASKKATSDDDSTRVYSEEELELELELKKLDEIERPLMEYSLRYEKEQREMREYVEACEKEPGFDELVDQYEKEMLKREEQRLAAEQKHWEKLKEKLPKCVWEVIQPQR
jgi:hypothetical protein